MKKRQIANLVMVAVIAVIVVAGVLGVGHIQGWFDTDDGTQAVLCDIAGIIDLERDGVSYPVTGDTVLRKGDNITCKSGATAVIRIGGDTVVIGECAALSVTDPSADAFAADVSVGQLLVNCSSATFTFEGHTVNVEASVILLSVRSGAQTVSVLAGTVDGVSAGNAIEYICEKTSVSALQISSFNDFALTQIRNANKTMTLCVTNAELDQLEAERLAALQNAINNAGSIQETEPAEPEHIHSYVDNVIAPTCTEKGYTSYTCTCGESYQDSYTDPTGHTWDDWVTTVQPTSQQEGTKQHKCVSCDATETQSVAKLAEDHVHSYTEKTIAATCTTDGYTLYTCSCGISYKSNTVSAVGHQYQDTVIAPTCTSGGYTVHTCSCGASYKDSATAATAHSWGDWVVTKEATTTAEGAKQRTCKSCGEKQQAAIEKLEQNTIAGYVYITIRCDTILDNMDDLAPAKVEFVPENGEIVPMLRVFFYEGDTVFDVLVRLCDTLDIQLEYSMSVYGSYYIEGINNLYEKDCGAESGWMYKVNEWFPNYGCSVLEVKDGDVIEWLYTCRGYGTDVGAPEWEE